MAIGYLTIQARTAHEALPLEGVQVRVLDDEGNSLYQLRTDESGETGTVPLETLDKSFSQNQYYSGLPYASYNVLAQKAGFDTIYVSNIPVYDRETAVLPLAMVPMQERQRRPGETKIFVGKPAVAMQEARGQVGRADTEDGSGAAEGSRPMEAGRETAGTGRADAGRAPGAGGTMEEGRPTDGSLQPEAMPRLTGTGGFADGNPMGTRRNQGGAGRADGGTVGSTDRILRQVVIPNPITVHLGPPGANVSNVQVSFPDYVKNVASSEIYPTWQEASLTANIHAIVTFALNRIYTEWYRCQ